LIEYRGIKNIELSDADYDVFIIYIFINFIY